MAFKYREEIVGKRFLSVCGSNKLKLSKISDWEWRTGVIRAATHRDCKHRDLTVLVEFDGVDWKRREWIRVHEEGAFRVFLVEHTLVWALRRQGPPETSSNNSSSGQTSSAKNLYWPALNFKALVDNTALNDNKQKPVEYLVDKQRDFVDYGELKVYQEADWENQSATRDYPEVCKAIKSWIGFQDGQRILLTTPSVLVGYRVEVYRAEGTTQWYTAVIISYNENTRELTLTDDTVLEEHNEDPSLVQMNLIGDGVVESILKGENVGITPRRRACNNQHNLPGPYGARTRSHSGQVSPAQPNNRPNNNSGSSPAASGQQIHGATSTLSSISNPVVAANVAATIAATSAASFSTSTTTSVAGSATGSGTSKKPRGFNKEPSPKNSPPRTQELEKGTRSVVPPAEPRRKSSSSSAEELVVSGSKISHPPPSTPQHLPKQQRTPAQDDDVTRNVSSGDQRRLHKASVNLNRSSAADAASISPDHADIKINHHRTAVTSLDSKQNVEPPPQHPSPHLGNKKQRSIKDISAVASSNPRTSNLQQQQHHHHQQAPPPPVSSSPEDIKLNGLPSISPPVSSASVITSVQSSPSPPKDRVATTVPRYPPVLHPEGISFSKSGGEQSQCPRQEPPRHNYPSQPSKSISSGNLPTDINNKVRSSGSAKNKDNNSSRGHPNPSESDPRTASDSRHDFVKQGSTSMHPAGLSPVYPRIPGMPPQPPPSQQAPPSRSTPTTSSGGPLPGPPGGPHLGLYGLQSTPPHMLPAHHHHPGAPALELQHSPAYRHLLAQAQAQAHAAQPMLPPSYTGAAVGLDVLWQQKYAHAGAPPPQQNAGQAWLVPATGATPYDIRLERERAAMVAHERDRQNRIEREKREEQDRMEREKAEREHREREKADKERKERERQQERERQDRERIERERMEKDKHERERAQREAVQQHFEESLRLAGHKWNMGWNSPLQLPKTPSSSAGNSIQNSGPGVVVSMAQSRMNNAYASEMERVEKERSREKIETESRERYLGLSTYDQERWFAVNVMHQQQYQQQQQQQQQQLRAEANAHAHGFPKSEPRSSSKQIKMEGYNMGHSVSNMPVSTSSKSNTSGSPAAVATAAGAGQSKLEQPSFSIYGYQPFQQHGYITQGQLKAQEESRQQTAGHPPHGGKQPSHSHSHSGAPLTLIYGQEKDNNGPLPLDRSNTPSSRTSTPIGRPPSLSPKHQVRGGGAGVGGPQSQQDYPASGVGGVSSHKGYDYFPPGPPGPAPAHQSSSPSLTGRNSGGGGVPPPPHQYASPHPMQVVDQPQNLVKSEPKNGTWQLTAGHPQALPPPSHSGQAQHPRYGSPKPVSSSPSPVVSSGAQQVPSGYHSSAKTSNPNSGAAGPPGPPAGTPYSYSLIQQGLVPNPLYASVHGGLTTAPPTTGANTAVVTSHQQPVHHQQSLSKGGPARVMSPNSAHHYAKNMAGITSGTPVCRANSVGVTASSYNHDSKMSRAYSPIIASAVGGPASSMPVKPIPMDLQSSRNSSSSAPVSLRGTPSPALSGGTVSPGVLQVTGNPGGHLGSESSSPRLTPNHMPHLPPSGSPQPHPGILPGHPRHSPSMTVAMQMQPLNLQSSASSNKRKTPKESGGLRKKNKSGEDLSMPPQLQPQAPIPSHKELSSAPRTVHHSSPPPNSNTASGHNASAASTQSMHSVAVTTNTWKPAAVSQPAQQQSNATTGQSRNSHLPPAPNPSSGGSGVGAAENNATPAENASSQSTGFMESFKSFVTTSHQVVDNDYAYGKIAKGKNKIKSENLTVSELNAPVSGGGGGVATDLSTGAAAGLITPKIENPPSPTPSTCTTNVSVPNSSTSTNHTKLKKAWLQRHSETEDKKNNPVTGTSASVNSATDTKPLLLSKDQIKSENAVSATNLTNNNNTNSGSVVNATTNSVTSLATSENSNSSTTSTTNVKNASNPVAQTNNHSAKDARSSRSNSATPPNAATGDKEEEDSTCSSSETEQELKKKKTPNNNNNNSTRVSRKRSTVGQTAAATQGTKRQKANAAAAIAIANASNDNSGDGSVADTPSNGVATSKKDKEDVGKRKSPAPDKDASNSKRRGRKPKGRGAANANSGGGGGGNGPTATTATNEDSNKKKTPKPFEKPSVAWLKRTGEPFLQDGACCDVAPKLPKCRECRMTPHQRSKKQPNIFCRFYAFRKLKYSKNNTLLSAGFSEPVDATPTDLKLWLPPGDDPPGDLDNETSKFLLAHVGDQFCDLVEQEREAQALHMGEDKTITWKRVVQGVREMCDVCETTLFNIHWVCHKCGFVVCIDCYKARKNGTVKEEELPPKDRDEYQWLLCNNRQPHEQEKLMLTQIIAGNALWDVGQLLHEVRRRWNIPSYCVCSSTKENEKEEKKTTNGICKQLMSAVTKNFLNETTQFNGDNNKSSKKAKAAVVNGLANIIKQEEGLGSYSSETGGSPLSWLADVALNSSNNKLASADGKHKKQKEAKNAADKTEANDDKDAANHNSDGNGGGDSPSPSSDGEDSKGENFSTLRELLIRPTGKGGNGGKGQAGSRKVLTSTLDEVISCVIEHRVGKVEKKEEKLLVHFTRRYPSAHRGREPLPIRICTLAESRLLYPDVPHSWLCHGKLLLLQDAQEEGNLRLFQEQWKRGQPVMVSEVSKHLDMSLWHPDGFCRDFGDVKNDLVNCKTGTVVPNQPMRKFWEGFENFSKRMKDDENEYMLLKLKDWPPGEDFSELLPSRFRDLMKVLPLPHYTHRDGVLNLAGRLPECFVRPDLGPKMYNAYGSALYPTKGTTNLHLDISDAVNVMVYVGIPKDGKDEEHIQEALRAIDEGSCDSLMRKRVRDKGVKPGALWHIYNARDADKIRDLLNKVAEEQGETLEAHHDPIHDQSWYLDTELRDRLSKEYGVEGYAIAQCLGDAVFIPAGAPHQVRNLHSCIKVAEDFVSPENIAHCFTLTQEFRHLSDTHTNHEDKLQIKNIIYHAVRDAMALLQSSEPNEK